MTTVDKAAHTAEHLFRERLRKPLNPLPFINSRILGDRSREPDAHALNAFVHMPPRRRRGAYFRLLTMARGSSKSCGTEAYDLPHMAATAPEQRQSGETNLMM